MRRRFFAALLLLSCLLAPVAIAADVSVTAANVIASSQARYTMGTAGGTITAGQPVYFDTADKRYKLADANDASPAYKVAGIAVNGASAGQSVRICTYDPSFTPGFTTAAGSVYIVSATAGGIAPVADAATGHYVSVLGVGTGTSTMKLSIVRADVVKP